ncbi:unnamed protein product [Tilletia laevis]|uniref:Uncharacterized protein n=2 Tax=Tilletia TaxID=13289 RepID=A0A177VFH9_9BASI|nr:hypothetical protein CF336_g6486 [Tilletia laevis]KAE8255592.1 hypothetical protein A4X03_0g5535 [Tilletia caries]KAE8192568.1 hypothetical protein CF335_g5808 [Tilletia laevis]CAD6887622.1 unnamed protein product [Tilletia caries]CAD6901611.1 unnamed protein product [Tilletia caries]
MSRIARTALRDSRLGQFFRSSCFHWTPQNAASTLQAHHLQGATPSGVSILQQASGGRSPPSLSKDDCERLVVGLLIKDSLQDDYLYNAYAVVVRCTLIGTQVRIGHSLPHRPGQRVTRVRVRQVRRRMAGEVRNLKRTLVQKQSLFQGFK